MKKIYLIVIICVLISVITFIAMRYNKTEKTLTVSSNQDISWKTYSNNRYSYTLKYPSNWYVLGNDSEADFTPRGPEAEKDFIGGDTSFSNYPNSYRSIEDSIPDDLFSVNLMVYKVSPDTTYNQFISAKNFEYDKKEEMIINEKSAMRLVGLTKEPVGFTVINTFVKINNKMFWFNIGGKQISKEMEDISNKIIQSFVSNEDLK